MSEDAQLAREIKEMDVAGARPTAPKISLRRKAATEQLFEKVSPSEPETVGSSGLSLAPLPQTRPATLSGKVTDRTGNPLPGANVVIKSTKIGAATGVNGNYAFNLPDTAWGQPVVVEARFIGYRAVRDTVDLSENHLTQNFVLDADDLEMDAITVVSTFDKTEQASLRSRAIPSMAADSSVTSLSRREVVGNFSLDSAEKPPTWSFKTNGKTVLLTLKLQAAVEARSKI